MASNDEDARRYAAATPDSLSSGPASIGFQSGNYSAYSGPNGVGISQLTTHVNRKAFKKGFDFTIMMVGPTYIGKTTLIQSVFRNTGPNVQSDNKSVKNPLAKKNSLQVHERLERTVSIETTKMDVEEQDVKLHLSLVDTPGFGDSLNLTEQYKPIVLYIEEQYENYLVQEQSVNRKGMRDTRVHLLLYALNPLNNGLTQADIETLKAVSGKVNILPVIMKADMLSASEVLEKKKQIMNDFKKNDIQIYRPECDPDDDMDFRERVAGLQSAIPFAVVASLEQCVTPDGKRVWGRQYPFGVVETENRAHSDLVLLRQMLIAHMLDMKEYTHATLYENYRAKRIAAGVNPPGMVLSNAVMNGSISTIASEADSQQLAEKDRELERLRQMVAALQAQQQPVSAHQVRSSTGSAHTIISNGSHSTHGSASSNNMANKLGKGPGMMPPPPPPPVVPQYASSGHVSPIKRMSTFRPETESDL